MPNTISESLFDLGALPLETTPDIEKAAKAIADSVLKAAGESSSHKVKVPAEKGQGR